MTFTCGTSCPLFFRYCSYSFIDILMCAHIYAYTYVYTNVFIYKTYKLHILMLEEHCKMCFLKPDVEEVFWLTNFRRKLQTYEWVDVCRKFLKHGASHERVWSWYGSYRRRGGRKNIKGDFWFWMTEGGSMKTLKESFRQFRNGRLWVWFSHPGFERLVSCLRWDMWLWKNTNPFCRVCLGYTSGNPCKQIQHSESKGQWARRKPSETPDPKER